MKDLECPYCGTEQDVCHDDGFGYEEDHLHEIECIGCSKTFCFQTSIYFSYTPIATPCLNGSPHNWKEKKSYGSGKEYVNGEKLYWRCADCDARTDENPVEIKP